MTNPRIPLRAIETFVVVARSLSLTVAADRLGMTVSGVSRRISDLEHELGADLFRRLNRRIELTPSGAKYLEAVGEAVDRIDEATASLRKARSRKQIRLSTMPLFASAWLLPRLADFRRERADIDLELETGADLVSFAVSDVDAGIRFGLGRWPGLVAEKILDVDLNPISAPSLAARPSAVSADMLDRYVFLSLDVPFPLWEEWFTAVGIPGYRPLRTKRFDDGQLMYEAAAAGMGLALGTEVLTGRLTGGGRLVPTFSTEPVRSRFAYYLVYRPRDRHWPPLRALGRALKGDRLAVGQIAGAAPPDAPPRPGPLDVPRR